MQKQTEQVTPACRNYTMSFRNQNQKKKKKKKKKNDIKNNI